MQNLRGDLDKIFLKQDISPEGDGEIINIRSKALIFRLLFKYQCWIFEIIQERLPKLGYCQSG